MSEFLKHPFVLLIAGAVLTGIIVPAITRTWQLSQKELEVKIGLVSEISDSTMRIVMAIQFVHLGVERYPDHKEQLSTLQNQLNDAYRTWEIQSAMIETKLQAYFPDTSLPRQWADFSNVVHDFYYQEGLSQAEIKTYAQGISERLSTLLNKRQVGQDWNELKAAIIDTKSEMIASILSSRTTTMGGWKLFRLFDFGTGV